MDDWRKLRSMNLAGILYDEADEFTPEDFEGMSSRLRQTRRPPRPASSATRRIERHGTVLACNPRGKNWIYRDFVDPQTRKKETEHFTSTTLDNPYLPVSFVNDMLAMPDPWVRAFVLCKFDDLVGAVYPEFAWDTHVIKPLKEYDPTGSSSWASTPARAPATPRCGATTTRPAPAGGHRRVQRDRPGRQRARDGVAQDRGRGTAAASAPGSPTRSRSPPATAART
jgi:hypothetical protein